MPFRGCARFLTVAVLIGCTRPAPPVEILAILPFENLASDNSSDWFSRAGSSALAAELAPSKNMYAVPADARRDAAAAGATRLLTPYFAIANGKIEIHASLEDARARNLAQYSVSGPVSNGFLPLLDRLAKNLSPTGRPYSTVNSGAFRQFGEGAFAAAIQADPDYGDAWVAWADSALVRGDRSTVAQIVSASSSHRLDPIARARLNYIGASDTAGKIQVLTTLSTLTPGDPQLFRRLGDLHLANRDFAAAIRDYQSVERLNPADPAASNLLGYAYAFAGDLDAARRSLREYQRQLGPDDSNALDSLGEISFYFGDFKAAEQFFLQGFQRNPGAGEGVELLKAAQARLLTGDLASADATFGRYLSSRNPATKAVDQAQWEFLTGRRKQAIARLQQVDTRYVRCQLAVWGASPALDACGPLEPAVGLLLAGKYTEAYPRLETLYRETNPSADGQIRTLLAWAALETGHLDRAASLTRLYPIPLSAGDSLLAGLVFPRFLYLRGTALKSQGKLEDANRALRLFGEYSGSRL